MRRIALPLTLLALALVPAGASAAAGGATYVPPGQGGASFGSGDRLVLSPVLRRLDVTPRRVAWNRVPRVRLRIDRDRGERVRAQIRFAPLTRSGARRTIGLGWVRTGRTVAARWPAGLRLKPGRYAVSVRATASDGRTLKRSRSVAVTVRRKPPPRPVAKPTPTLPVGTVAGVFPVRGAYTLGDGLGGDRGDHRHEGQDILAARGLAVVAPLAGTVAFTDFQGSGAGEYVVLDTPAYDFFFAHCVRRSTRVRAGQAVAAGTRLCSVGSTGRSSGPHLHFEAWAGGPWRRGGHPVDPLPLLRRWGR